ncbi:outer membrane protein assembly factor BamD [Lutibacter sp. HS1-25]|uniref:outer membrane protein assembly factor BamD n=1 Tax=Lutibacter sp. HS1-25 TaxID=2485000 RepID=UPI001010EEDB|nr:outer membrane protein assembly factor BamD [Lutibacter sp. HS1-25]RXP52282.1 outer membrane protein assembly factor BamD [Lutibacter sp. HS1-25]
MQKNKIYIFILLVALGISSCGDYSKVLNKGTAQEQYQMATDLYEAQSYTKAIGLFEKITPFYRGKPQMERIQFMISQSYYNTKQYKLSAYYFDKFVKNYPSSSKVEESAYLAAYSYYLSSPIYSLDQKDTHEALNALQNFIYKYPESDKVPEANANIKDLTFKLEKKAFEIAKQYYNMSDFISAITSFDNFLGEYLGTSYKEEALYYRFMSSYKLAINSYYLKKEMRLRDAIKAHDKYKKSFPNAENLKETEKLVEEINEEINLFTAQKTENNGL